MSIRRILLIPAVAALAVSGALVFGAVGTASAATTAPAAQRAVIAQPVAADDLGWIKYDYYSSQLLCELEGSAMLGDTWGGGVIVEYSCEYFPGAGWALWILVEPAGCPAVTGSPPTGVAPGAKVSPSTKVC
jgi:hypothetical protein